MPFDWMQKKKEIWAMCNDAQNECKCMQSNFSSLTVHECDCVCFFFSLLSAIISRSCCFIPFWVYYILCCWVIITIAILFCFHCNNNNVCLLKLPQVLNASNDQPFQNEFLYVEKHMISNLKLEWANNENK